MHLIVKFAKKTKNTIKIKYKYWEKYTCVCAARRLFLALRWKLTKIIKKSRKLHTINKAHQTIVENGEDALHTQREADRRHVFAREHAHQLIVPTHNNVI